MRPTNHLKYSKAADPMSTALLSYRLPELVLRRFFVCGVTNQDTANCGWNLWNNIGCHVLHRYASHINLEAVKDASVAMSELSSYVSAAHNTGTRNTQLYSFLYKPVSSRYHVRKDTGRNTQWQCNTARSEHSRCCRRLSVSVFIQRPCLEGYIASCKRCNPAWTPHFCSFAPHACQSGANRRGHGHSRSTSL